MRTLLVLICVGLTRCVVLGQTIETWNAIDDLPATQSCPDGRCRLVPGLPDSKVRAEWRVTPVLGVTQREMIGRTCGYARLRVVMNDGSQRWGSAVCAGHGPDDDAWVFLSAGHIFDGVDERSRIELDVRGAWRTASVIVSERSPDRAVLRMEIDEPLRSPVISQRDEADGPAVMVGFPGGGEAKAFLGRVSDVQGTLAWLTFDRASHFDCINGASGGGVYGAAGELIGIQSCTDSRGLVKAVGFTPIAAWDEVFARLGWSPHGWGRGCRSQPITPPCEQVSRPTKKRNEISEHDQQQVMAAQLRRVEVQLENLRKAVGVIDRGPQGERGEHGETGPQGEPGPSVAPTELEQAIAAYFQAHPPEQADFNLLEERLRTVEQRMDVPFEVQLFDSGRKVGGSRFVRPHGGYLPLDVFGDVENVAGQERGE